jgi:glutamyl-tRNA synthetase
MTLVTRIAPSPTGDPHVGTAYVGLFNYVFAKGQGGKFILRLEDTDQGRYNRDSEARILEMMHWLGLDPDESPETGGENGPYRQSERLEIYKRHAQELLEAGHLYRAFETPEELAVIREEVRRKGLSPGYDGRARALSRQASDKRAAAGEPFVLRLKTPEEGETAFHDELRGPISIPNSEIYDGVMVKSDGYPTYHFANVVDDHLMGVTHVIRAEEWITSTPIHVLLYRAFGWEAPKFFHLPLLRNPDANKSKISKRKMDTSVDSYRQQGILPEALLNFLGTMGWSMPDGREFFSVEDMTAHFSWERISLGGPVFDMKRLRFFNAKYLREFLRLEDLAERVKPHLEAAGIAWDDDDYLLDVLDITKNRVETLAEFPRVVAYFFKEDFSFEEDAKKRLASGQKYLEDLELEFARLESYDEDSIDEMLHDYVQSQSVGMGKVLQPLRAALTGTLQAPGITELVSVLGRDRVLRRVGRALAAITAGLPDDRPVKNDKNDKKEDKKEDERGAA